ncbi:MAG: hypothetical protein AABX66_03055 [Nanoarchaeota archaeon]
MEFVAFVGKDAENWGQITALMNRLECERVILVQNKESGDFPVNEKTTVIKVDSSKPMIELKEFIMEKIKPLLSGDFEVAVSLASGNGKEHMAFISALINVPVGIRIVAFTKEGIAYLS